MIPTIAILDALVLGVSPLLAANGVGDADFAQVRAVIERRCLECHGGDARESRLSLASAADFRAGGARGPVVDADDLGSSRLLAVVSYDDPNLAMPPDGVLPPTERALLEAWVLAGADWPEGPAGQLADRAPLETARARPGPTDPWWAYAPLHRSEPPPVEDPAWSAHPIDAFIEARREAAGLDHADPAAPEDLLRRASFDLTGLPPSAEQREAFLHEVESLGADAAWDRLVERLLASPHHAEHQARRWLDWVRYAETNGYERDGPKTNIWRYRDWVVRAFHSDLPYDRFAKAQLAGDEYAHSVEDPRERAELLLATGYYRLGLWDDEPSDREQAQADERADIVDTTSQVFMGTTLGCARCHDHKADPFSQQEYFAFSANFAGLIGYGGGGFGSHLGGGATRDVIAPSDDAAWTGDERAAALASLDAQIERLLGPLPPAELGPTLLPDARGAGVEWAFHQGPPEDGFETPGFDDAHWPRGPGGFGTAGTPGARIGTEWSSARIQLRTTFGLDSIPEALLLDLHHDEDVVVWLNGLPIVRRAGFRTDYATIQLPPDALAALVVGRNVLAVDCSQSGGGQYVDLGLRAGFDPAAADASRATAALRATRIDDPDARRRVEELLAERSALAARPVAEPFPAQVAFEAGAEAPVQHVHLRGSVHAPGAVVEPDVPRAWSAGADPRSAAFAIAPPAAEASSSGRRRALAEWLFEGGAHLAARVEANRVWQGLFGRGLCATPGDFGRLGLEPSHPELLDHLAWTLIESGWSRKALIRHVLESRAYRMAVVGPAAAGAADPENRLHWRHDPRRLGAEEFRDATLAASGELVPELFGPSVYPPLPAEVLASASRPDQAWGRSTPEDAARRSLYVHVKRSLREPLLAALDQPDPDLPCPERFPTNVPTQALLTLNGDFVNARAAALAAAVDARYPSLEEALGAAIERALSRPPRAGELARGAALIRTLEERHGLERLRALTLFTLGLFNRNEFLWLD